MTQTAEDVELFITTLHGLWKAIGQLNQVSRENRYLDRMDWVRSVQRDLWKEEQHLQALLDDMLDEWNVDEEQIHIVECSSVNSYNEYASKDCLIFTTNILDKEIQPATHGIRAFRLTKAECSKCEENRLRLQEES